MRPNIIASLGACLLLSPVALGQDVLFYNSGGFHTFPLGAALRDLELDYVGTSSTGELLDELRTRTWDLVVIRHVFQFLPDVQADVLAELEAHVARGGRLHVQMADLEHAPDGWYDLLGLEGAVDLELPLSPIEFAPPKHPSVPGGGFHLPGNQTFPPDYGDALVPAFGSTVTQRFLVDQRPSTVLSRSGRILVNGQQWDNWSASGAAGGTIGNQIRWLLRCPADLDLDGEATIADFLVFQNLFDRRDTVADVDGDGAWTVFDFLAFMNMFEDGCQ